MGKTFIHIPVLILTMLITMNVSAQESASNDPSFVTERPGASDRSQTLGKGVLQIETGVAYTTFEDQNFKFENTTYNTSLFRYGLLDNLELRLGTTYDEVKVSSIMNDSLPENKVSGFLPLLVGAKIDIINEKGWIPQIALVGQILLPFGATEEFRPNTTGTNFRFACSNTLSEKSSLTYNFGAQWNGDSPEASYLYTLNYGVSVNDKLGFFAELYGDFPENNTANHLWDVGFVYLISDDFQLDVSAGTSITEGQDLFIGGGFSYRILK